MAAVFVPPVAGQASGRVRGIVTDEDGNPLANVKILMKSTTYTFKLETVSDNKGKWAFLGFDKDVFEFTFSKDGFETGQTQVFLSGVNRNPDQTIVLIKKVKDFAQGVVDPADRELLKTASEMYEAGQYAEAVPLLKEFIDGHPTIYMARGNLAKTYLKLKQYADAIAEYQKILEALKADAAATEIDAKTADIYVAMAEAYQDQGLYDQAGTYYMKAVDLIPPTDPAVPFNLAELLFRANRVDDAIRYYGLAIQLKPEAGLYELKLGFALLNKGDTSSAVEHFEKFLTLSPDDPQAESIRNLIKTIKNQ
jgi:tetratricopeptide (TPR) repeat protein